MLFTAVLFLSTLGSAQAELVDRDYLTSGDALLTYDTVNQLEWLELSLTNNMTLAQADALYTDFNLPTSVQVDDLFNQVFVGFITTGGGSNYSLSSGYEYASRTAEITQWHSLFAPSGGYNIAYGYYTDENQVMRLMGARSNEVSSLIVGPDNGIVYLTEVTNSYIGTYLVRNASAVPVSAHFLGLLALLGMFGVSVKRRQ
jgi:hypothetical protein